MVPKRTMNQHFKNLNDVKMCTYPVTRITLTLYTQCGVQYKNSTIFSLQTEGQTDKHKTNLYTYPVTRTPLTLYTL